MQLLVFSWPLKFVDSYDQSDRCQLYVYLYVSVQERDPACVPSVESSLKKNTIFDEMFK